MVIRIRKDLVEKIGLKNLAKFGVQDKIYGVEHADVSLAGLSDTKLTELEDLLKSKGTGKLVTLLLQDISTWRTAKTSDPGPLKARTVQSFHALMERYLAQFPGHRLMHKDDQLWLSSYVNRVAYEPPGARRGGDESPPCVRVDLLHQEYGKLESNSIRIDEADIRGKAVSEVLALKGYFPESSDRRADYLKEGDRFKEVVNSVGRQFLATGFGDDSPDGNPTDDEREGYWRRSHDVELVQDGEPSRVVADVFFEAQEGSRRFRRNDADNAKIDQLYWNRVAEGWTSGDDDETPHEPSAISEDAIEVPVHPFVVVFHLKKHLRLRVHIGQLTDYKYDLALADKLILSSERKTLVQMLIEMKSGVFRDIVKGKGGGAVVLLAGAPGTGKTLTAEVYAEAEQRPLYSIQCSQLGTDPDELEDALLKVFDRGRRWQAVMLLDEADVYVHQRGNDMQQNAVVGVFLRVLEYQGSVLFLTTNRPDDVDDAIASRCIAKLTYQVPTSEEQALIWKVLADGAQLRICDSTIARIVEQNPSLSGRDVKNLLKLASVIVKGSEITADAVAFVKQFKPTA